MAFFRWFFISLFFCLMTGCMLGPDFHTPKAPKVKAFTETPLPKQTVATPSLGNAGKAQTFVNGKNLPADWWYLFHSPEINALIAAGLANNPDLASAYAALRVAQENMNAQIGNSLFPAFSTVLNGQRQLFTGATIGGDASGPSIFNIFNATVNVSYTLDIFGGARRQIEALKAQVDYQQFQLIAAYLTLTTNIVTTAVTIASFEAQIAATNDLLSGQRHQLEIIQKQFNLGGVTKEQVLTQQVLVEQTTATLPPLEKGLSQAKHLLSVLVGRFPDDALPRLRLEAITLPGTLPVSLPSQIVRQRPDVRASEALLHAATAQIGVATANLFPQFSIAGNYGWQAFTPSTLFATTSNAWSIAGQFVQPVFQGGALRAAQRGAVAAYDQAWAQYKKVVLQSFQNVADTLKALEIDAKTLRARKRAETSACKNMRITKEQYRLGGVSQLDLLNAQQQCQTTRIGRIQAEALRYNDTAALFQALGGGWWNKEWCVKNCYY